jgi:hypothetical protein
MRRLVFHHRVQFQGPVLVPDGAELRGLDGSHHERAGLIPLFSNSPCPLLKREEVVPLCGVDSERQPKTIVAASAQTMVEAHHRRSQAGREFAEARAMSYFRVLPSGGVSTGLSSPPASPGVAGPTQSFSCISRTSSLLC